MPGHESKRRRRRRRRRRLPTPGRTWTATTAAAARNPWALGIARTRPSFTPSPSCASAERALQGARRRARAPRKQQQQPAMPPPAGPAPPPAPRQRRAAHRDARRGLHTVHARDRREARAERVVRRRHRRGGGGDKPCRASERVGGSAGRADSADARRRFPPASRRTSSDAVVVPAEAAAVVGDASARGRCRGSAVDDEYARMMAELGGGLTKAFSSACAFFFSRERRAAVDQSHARRAGFGNRRRSRDPRCHRANCRGSSRRKHTRSAPSERPDAFHRHHGRRGVHPRLHPGVRRQAPRHRSRRARRPRRLRPRLLRRSRASPVRRCARSVSESRPAPAPVPLTSPSARWRTRRRMTRAPASSSSSASAAASAPTTSGGKIRLQLTKPVTWVPLIWGVMCGAAASGHYTWTPENIGKAMLCMFMSGPLLTGTHPATPIPPYPKLIRTIQHPQTAPLPA